MSIDQATTRNLGARPAVRVERFAADRRSRETWAFEFHAESGSLLLTNYQRVALPSPPEYRTRTLAWYVQGREREPGCLDSEDVPLESAVQQEAITNFTKLIRVIKAAPRTWRLDQE